MSKIVNKRFRKTNKKIDLNVEHFSSIHEPKEFVKSVVKPLSSTSPKHKQRKMETIGRFMKRTTQKRKIRFLTKICSDSGECMALGKEWKIINRVFNGFVSFDFVTSIKKIGANGANGFIKEIEYTQNQYVSYAILKSNKTQKSDNLGYEYWTGQIINQWCSIFPCFVRTYGYYLYDNHTTFTKFKDDKQTIGDLQNVVLQLKDKDTSIIDWANACKNNQYSVILIEHVKDSQTLEQMVSKKNDETFVNGELLFILLQIYYPLFMLIDIFTHYDLHTANILVYTLPNDTYVNYSFVDPNSGKIITFKTPYIIKIIDYGRCYIYDRVRQISTKTIYETVCKISECDNCGKYLGFLFFKDEMTIPYIDSVNRNMSSDLRCLNYIKYRFGEHIKVNTPLYRKMKGSVKQLFDDLVYSERYGTPPLSTDKSTGKIRNVSDAYERLIRILSDEPERLNTNSHLYNDPAKCIGTLYIDGKNAMRFTSSVSTSRSATNSKSAL